LLPICEAQIEGLMEETPTIRDKEQRQRREPIPLRYISDSVFVKFVRVDNQKGIVRTAAIVHVVAKIMHEGMLG